MIDKTMIELINKDIDKTISPGEKEKLSQYLKENPDANVLYNELLKAEHMLDKLEDLIPSPNLKERILNSIDYNLYSTKKKNSEVLDYLSSIFAGSRSKFAVSFALGMIAGLIILTVIFYNSTFHDELNNYNTSGTIGLHKSNIIQTIDILSEDIYGSVDVSKVNNFYGFDIKLNSQDKYRLLIEFDSANLSLDNFSLNDLNSVSLEQGPDYVQISGSQDLDYFLSFSAKASTSEKFILKILKENREVFKREVFVSKN
ncbi:MAG TPA: hypothetical protein VF870_11620 [Ignavibacteriaceae bacterium]